MANTNLLSNRNDNEKRKHLAKCAQVLTEYFNKWRVIFPTHEVSKVQMALYLEALESFSVNELQVGCAEVIKTALTFPKPAEIISAAHSYTAEEYLGPRRPTYLNEPVPIRSKEEQEECDKYSEALRKTLLTVPEPFRDKEGNHTAACLCIRCRRRRNDAARDSIQNVG